MVPRPANSTRTAGTTVGAAERRERAKRAPSLAPHTLARLALQHPSAHCELHHRSPFELVVSVVLSAQTTDVAVNKATPKLFAQFPDARSLAIAEPAEVEPYVASLGFYRMKSKAIVGLARALVEKHHGEVPRSLAELVALPGVGRKTANVVLGVLWNQPEGVVVDTHVMRISQRLGWSKNAVPEAIERDLCAILPREDWDRASHVLIFHGRYCCYARKPGCEQCSVSDVCPSAFDADHVGRKTRPGLLNGSTPRGKDKGRAPVRHRAASKRGSSATSTPVEKPASKRVRQARPKKASPKRSP